MSKSNIVTSLSRLRQWFYPKEFRIDPINTYEWTTALTKLLEQAANTGQKPNSELLELGLSAHDFINQNPGIHLDEDQIVKLCNDLFKAIQEIAALAEDLSNKEVRAIRRPLDNALDALKEKGVECMDFTGQEFQPGRSDFSAARKVEELPDLNTVTIIACKRPAVIFQGKLLQKASGTIAKPIAKPVPSDTAEANPAEQQGALH